MSSKKQPDFSSLPYRPCAGIVLINREGLVFSGKRLDVETLAPGAWQMPQGGIDKGEDPTAAAFREMEEEIGTSKARLLATTADWLTYDLPSELLGRAWKGRYKGQKQLWFALAFEGDDDDINIETDHPEFAEWRWMKAADLLTCAVDFKRAVYEQVFDEFGDLLA